MTSEPLLILKTFIRDLESDPRMNFLLNLEPLPILKIFFETPGPLSFHKIFFWDPQNHFKSLKYFFLRSSEPLLIFGDGKTLFDPWKNTLGDYRTPFNPKVFSWHPQTLCDPWMNIFGDPQNPLWSLKEFFWRSSEGSSDPWKNIFRDSRTRLVLKIIFWDCRTLCDP